MSTVLDNGGVTAPGPTVAARARRRWGRWIAGGTVGIVLVGAIGTGIGFDVYARTYQPLAPGNYGEWTGLHTVPLGDGLEQTRVVVDGPAGTVGRMEYSLSNNGSHAVRVQGLGPYSGISRIAWGPALDKNLVSGGTPSEARPFPYTLKAHSVISIWVYVTQPRCTKSSVAQTVTHVPIRWKAFGVSHLYELPLAGENSPPITTCAGAKALSYRYRP